ncbi:sulfate adenylyltransferase [Siminovitchia fortis]|uniref:Sulfate adenylyltransferase n=1 Tax=Siminovitchia fortis TaxID=254758 RepID=A0A443J3Y5_9BACI|nr:sulfate adenylyltransferase [Siminovitchia fortis]RWR15268.1 sulfate adenylyltransferase [Siminovitchia fortis]WHY82580.1 sulfate adenylyltransferase [Siminovitchia fortis]
MSVTIQKEESSILPHGGDLIQRELVGLQREAYLKKADSLKSLKLDAWGLSDLELIGIGGFSPLNGFMGQKDYIRVIEEMRLADGTLWSIPITLHVSGEEADEYEIGTDIALTGEDDIVYGVLHLQEKYSYDKEKEARLVFGTVDTAHPGVNKIYEKGEVYLAGPIYLLNRPNHTPFEEFYLTPRETRNMFAHLGWKTIVGFQTRNPVHRSHEYIQKCALESVDGLLLNPLVGETKADDIPAEIRMESYQVVLQHYFPTDRAKLVIYPAAMRYGGPREAILHAIVRKNYGCTHFIVGRDHAGVGDYYGTYEAQELISQFEEELGIQIFKFENAFYCTKCENMATAKTCPHDEEFRVLLSGTKVREKLRNGEDLPKEFSRPEVAAVLVKGLKQKELI